MMLLRLLCWVSITKDSALTQFTASQNPLLWKSATEHCSNDAIAAKEHAMLHDAAFTRACSLLSFGQKEWIDSQSGDRLPLTKDIEMTQTPEANCSRDSAKDWPWMAAGWMLLREHRMGDQHWILMAQETYHKQSHATNLWIDFAEIVCLLLGFVYVVVHLREQKNANGLTATDLYPVSYSEREQEHDSVDIVNEENGMHFVVRRLNTESQMSFENLEFLNVIGSGSFKTVYRGRWGANHVAIACMKQGGILLEARLMEHITCHPNLVTFFRWSTDAAGNEYVITELLSMGSLDSVLRDPYRTVSVGQKIEICTQVCHAMQHLAAENVLHRDLAARNVLVQSIDPVAVKVTDFGMAKNAHSSTEGLCGVSDVLPVKWVPPEVLQHSSWSEKSDVWAFGVTLWEIFSDGREPYTSEFVSDLEVVQHILQGGILQQPPNCPDFIYALMKQCWRFEPQDRPTFFELNHRLLTNDGMERKQGMVVIDEKEPWHRLDAIRPQKIHAKKAGSSEFYFSMKEIMRQQLRINSTTC